MPLLHFYHSPKALKQQDKQQIAQAFTDLYATVLPRFYVNVIFHEIAPQNFFIGGEMVDDFIRVSIDHIARSFNSDEGRQRFLQACQQILSPYIEKSGLRWELHIDETPFDLWIIQGIKPPMPHSEIEQKWRTENKASVY